MWVPVAFIMLAAIGGLALFLAIQRNGAAVLDTIDRIAGGADDVALIKQVRLGDASEQKLTVYGPKNGSKNGSPGGTALPVILFVHGGGWNWGSPDDYGFVARAFAPEGFVVVLAGYRLYPDVTFPSMLEDTARAVRWTRENIARHGGDPDRIVLAGHSAGAYNVTMLALDRQWLGREGQSADQLAGVIGLSGPYDFYPFTNESARNSFGAVPQPADTQPVNFARGDAPPLLLIHGEADTLVKPRNSRELARRIAGLGGSARLYIHEGMNHSQPLIALAAPWRRKRQILDLMVEFARQVSPSVPVQGETR